MPLPIKKALQESAEPVATKPMAKKPAKRIAKDVQKSIQEEAAFDEMLQDEESEDEEDSAAYKGIHRKLRIPKSQYDDEGNPINTLDIDPANLVADMNKFLG